MFQLFNLLNLASIDSKFLFFPLSHTGSFALTAPVSGFPQHGVCRKMALIPQSWGPLE